tara:strand:+ start:57 stop:305 length:249 start_codon:yes stop_codon:yes gene_type:complete
VVDAAFELYSGVGFVGAVEFEIFDFDDFCVTIVNLHDAQELVGFKLLARFGLPKFCGYELAFYDTDHDLIPPDIGFIGECAG